MKGETRIIDLLNDAIRHELTTTSQFWLHYRLLENWGFGAMSHQWKRRSIDEMKHADTLIARMIFLQGVPNLQKLDPLLIADTLREVLDADLKAVYRARGLYREAATAAAELGDYPSKDMFEALLADEETHIDFLETHIDLYERIGEQEYSLLSGSPANEAD